MTSSELKSWRKSLKLTQKEFAALVSQGERTIQSWESGDGIPDDKVEKLRILVEQNYAKLRTEKDSISSLPHQKVEITDKHGSTSQVDAVRVDEMEDYTRAKEIGVSLIPQYEEGFRGGYEGEKDEIKSISTYWGLPNVAGQSMYPVRGDSMAPKYPADCKVVSTDFASISMAQSTTTSNGSSNIQTEINKKQSTSLVAITQTLRTSRFQYKISRILAS